VTALAADCTVIVKHVVRYVTCRPCSVCERPLKGNRLIVRTQIVKGQRGRGLSFGVGVFCSVRCLLRFANQKERDGCASIRGWTFGEATGEGKTEDGKTAGQQARGKAGRQASKRKT